MMEIYLDEINQSISDEFDQYFKFIDYIASGSFGTVIKAIYLETNKVVAVKVINKGGREKQKNIARLKQEITILKQLKHKNIVEFHGFIETNQKIYIIMEYIQNGTLKTLMEKRKERKITEEEASKMMECLFSAVDYLHSREICHRDIKPENILFDNYNDVSTLKLVDFGLSAQYFEVLEEYEFCGTLIYMAPEQIEKRVYSKTIDIWSCGIIMYMLLNNGKHPIYAKGDRHRDYVEKLKKPKWTFQNKVSK
jgi:serine/threonine protein kinase